MILEFLVNAQQTKTEGQQTANGQSEGTLKEHRASSIFERILSTPNTSHLIKLIWEKFDLSKKIEILSLVSILNNHYKYNNFLDYSV